MIKKLRKKFILTNMLLVSLVLVAVFAIQIGSSYQRSLDQSYAALRGAINWGRDGGPNRYQIQPDPTLRRGQVQPGDDRTAERLSPMFLTFLIETNEEGALLSLNRGNNVDLEEETAQTLITQVLSTGQSEGVLSGTGLRFLMEQRGESTYIAFADRSWETENLLSLLRTALLVGALALAGFFLISLFLSGLAVKPVETSWEQQRRFIADASHELKTPLTVILTNTDILLSHPEDPIREQSKWLEYTRAEAQQMRGLVDDMLFLAKNDAAKTPTLPCQLDFSDLLLSCCLTFEAVAFEAGVTLRNQAEPALWLSGDADSLRRLIGILLDNACKYAGKGGAVEVALTREGDKALLTVHNTGCPISPEHLSHLFDRFYRADLARSRQDGGYGLGLAIAKSIVDTHKGSIAVTSDEGGTTFRIALPTASKNPPA